MHQGFLFPAGGLDAATQNAPGLVRNDHQATAQAAALSVFPRTGTQRKTILDEIWRNAAFGATRDELAERLAMSPNTVRPRVKELIDAGFVKWSGLIRDTPLGHKAEVLIVTAAARAVLDAPPAAAVI